jgi:hypothetical protein
MQILKLKVEVSQQVDYLAILVYMIFNLIW